MSTNNSEDKKSRKYDTKIRKKISHKISKITDKEEYIKIFKVVTRDLGGTFSENKNGIWFNLNMLSDDAVGEILELLNSSLDTATSESENKFKYIPYDPDYIGKIGGPRLSNHEKSLIRKIRIADSEEV